MNVKYLSVLLIITVSSIGIVSSLNMASAQNSYAPSSTGTTSGMNSQAGTLAPNSTSSSVNSSTASNPGNSQAGTLANSTSSPNSSMNSQAGTLASNSTSNSGSQNATSNQLMFTETGLKTGWGVCWPFWSCVPTWGVMHNGQTNNVTTNTLSMSVPSGEYPYIVVSPSGYTASPSSDKLMISGTTNQTIHFIPSP